MSEKFEGLSGSVTAFAQIIDWEVAYGDKSITGEYRESYDFWGEYEWDIKIHEQDKLTDEEIDEIYDYIKDNIKSVAK